jgi:hypothetical protein
MGFFSRFKNAAVKTIGVIGKVKDNVDKGIQMYDKGKAAYSQAKQAVGGIPGAAEAIAKAEDKANAAIKAKTGVDVQSVNRGVGVARQVSNETGNVLNVVGKVVR